MKLSAIFFITLLVIFVPCLRAKAAENGGAPVPSKTATSKTEDKLPWWPTDAQPAPVKDDEKGGFWWWPSTPGAAKDLWGNRGYAYVNKIVYDWRGHGGVKDVQVNVFDVGFVETEEKPSLLIKRTIRSQKISFKDGASDIKPEHTAILKKVVESLKHNKSANVLIAAYNDASELGNARIQAIEKFLVDQGVLQVRINVLAPEKFQEAGLSLKQLSGQGAIQLVIAEVQEVMIPGPR